MNDLLLAFVVPVPVPALGAEIARIGITGDDDGAGPPPVGRRSSVRENVNDGISFRTQLGPLGMLDGSVGSGTWATLLAAIKK